MQTNKKAIDLPTEEVIIEKKEFKSVSLQELTLMDIPPRIYGTCKGGKTVINIHDYETIILVEGLEDGLTLHQTYLLNNLKRTVWVMNGTSNFSNVEIPQSTKTIILALDNDEAGEQMFQKCKERFSNLNKAVLRVRPKPEYNDFNDELRGIRINADK